MDGKKLDKMPKDVPSLNKEAVGLLTDLIFREENPKIPKKVDLIFLFGSLSSVTKRKELLYKLLKNKICDKVLISGGINTRRKICDYKGKKQNYNLTKISEAEILEKEMELSERKDIKVYKEEKSTNTSENVVFSLKLLENLNFGKIKKILFITRSYHVGRCYLTLRKHLKDAKIFYASYDSEAKSGYDEIITRYNWHKTQDGKSKVWGEFLRFIKYGKEQGNIEFEEVREKVGKLERSLF